MATPKYTALATVTLASTDSEIVFASIPAGYRDLILQVSAKNASGVDTIKIIYNSDTTMSNYSCLRAIATSSNTTLSQSFTSASYIGITTSDNFDPNRIQIMDYSATDKHKTALSTQAGVTNSAGMWAHRWASTSAISTVAISTTSGYSFSVGSTFDLFGVK